MIQLAKHYLGVYAEENKDIKKALFWLEKAESLGSLLARDYIVYAQKHSQSEPEEEEQADQELEKILDKSEKPETSQGLTLSTDSLEPPQKDFASASASAAVAVPPSSSSSSSSSDEDDNASDGKQEAEGSSGLEIRNPKYLREQLKEAYRLKQKREAAQQRGETRELGKQTQHIADDIMAGRVIKKNELETLFADDYFNGQVVVGKTKNGTMVSGHNRADNTHETVSTHREHPKNQKKKRFKGDFDPAFIKELRKVLELFGITDQSAATPA